MMYDNLSIEELYQLERSSTIERRQIRQELLERTGHFKPGQPPILTQVRNFSGAVGRVARAAVAGTPVIAEPEVVTHRLVVCSQCELWIAERKRCSKCGCHTSAKVRLATEKCPDGRW